MMVFPENWRVSFFAIVGENTDNGETGFRKDVRYFERNSSGRASPD